MDDNPYQPPMAATEPEVEAGEVGLTDAESRLLASVAMWMRIAGTAFVGAGALWLLISLRALTRFGDFESALMIVSWLLPELLIVLAGIWLLRSGNAFAGARIGTSTLAAAFSNLRWHLIAIGAAPLVLVVRLIDWPWEVLP